MLYRAKVAGVTKVIPGQAIICLRRPTLSTSAKWQLLAMSCRRPLLAAFRACRLPQTGQLRALHFSPAARQMPRFPIQQVARQSFNKQGRTPPYKPVAFFFTLGGVYYVAHLEKTETGRYRFIDVSPTTEEAMGDQAAQEVMQQYGRQLLPPSDSRVRQVKRVVRRLLDASGEQGKPNLGAGAVKWEGV
jgi:hypothetical protein